MAEPRVHECSKIGHRFDRLAPVFTGRNQWVSLFNRSLRSSPPSGAGWVGGGEYDVTLAVHTHARLYSRIEKHGYNDGAVRIVDDFLSDGISSWLLRPTPNVGVKDLPSCAAAIATGRGQVRPQNQDRVVVATFETGVPREAFQLFAVCDGVGGMQDGARCAALAIAYAIEDLVVTRALSSTESRLRSALESANKRICKLYQEDGGTTFAAVLLSSSGPMAVSVGDTRIYLGDPKQPLKQLTVDDTIAGRVAAITDNEDAANGIFGNRLAQYVGQRAPLVPQIINLASAFDYSGDVNASGNRGILIATDGAYRYTKATFESISRASTTLRDLVMRLVYVAEWTGGSDNATALYLSTTARMQAAPFSSEFAQLRIQDPFGDFQMMVASRDLKHQNYPVEVQPQSKVGEVNPAHGILKTDNKEKKRSKDGRRKKMTKTTKPPVSEQPELEIEVTSIGNYRR